MARLCTYITGMIEVFTLCLSKSKLFIIIKIPYDSSDLQVHLGLAIRGTHYSAYKLKYSFKLNKEEVKDQESIQSSTKPDPVHHIGK